MFDEELDKYNTYEEYLDSLVSEEDHKYLQDEEMARAIAELGYRYVYDSCKYLENYYEKFYHLIFTSDLQGTLSLERIFTH